MSENTNFLSQLNIDLPGINVDALKKYLEQTSMENIEAGQFCQIPVGETTIGLLKKKVTNKECRNVHQFLDPVCLRDPE